MYVKYCCLYPVHIYALATVINTEFVPTLKGGCFTPEILTHSTLLQLSEILLQMRRWTPNTYLAFGWLGQAKAVRSRTCSWLYRQIFTKTDMIWGFFDKQWSICGLSLFSVMPEMLYHASWGLTMGLRMERLTSCSHFLSGCDVVSVRQINSHSAVSTIRNKLGMMGMNRWIEHFKDMESMGKQMYGKTSNKLDMQCIRFSYMDVLSHELLMYLQLWNTHYIRQSHNASVHGEPDIM